MTRKTTLTSNKDNNGGCSLRVLGKANHPFDHHQTGLPTVSGLMQTEQPNRDGGEARGDGSRLGMLRWYR